MSDADVAYADAGSQTPLPEGLLCPGCGYDLRGLTSERCPECGFGLAELRAGEAQIPWVHRARLGWFKAYWKTVWWVTRWPERLPPEMARPVNYRDSQSFRWITTLHAYGLVLAASVLWCVLDWWCGWRGGEALWWGLAAVHAASLALLAGLPGVASYFFQSRRLPVEQQNRAIALSYYAWAPLALAPLALPFFAAGLWTLTYGQRTSLLEPDTGGTPLLAMLVCLFSAGLWEGRLYTLFRRVIHAGATASLLRILLLNVSALALGLLALLLPLGAFYLAVIFHSLG